MIRFASITCFLLGLLTLTSCLETEYSPNQKFDSNSPQGLNSKNIERILNETRNDTVRFVVCGDPQLSQSETNDLVSAVNKLKGVDFLFVAGDLTEYGLLQEMEWIQRKFSKLNIPYLAVPGNHDMIGNGSETFKRMFGDLNYSFVYENIKFICHNTNSRENNFDGSVPNIEWLNKEVTSENGVTGTIAIGHVPPVDNDFDATLRAQYYTALNRSNNLLGGFYAHQNNFATYYPDGRNIPYHVTTDIAKHGFILAEIVYGKLKTEYVEF